MISYQFGPSVKNSVSNSKNLYVPNFSNKTGWFSPVFKVGQLLRKPQFAPLLPDNAGTLSKISAESVILDHMAVNIHQIPIVPVSFLTQYYSLLLP